MTYAVPGDDLPTLVGKLERLNQLYAMLSRVNRSIVRAEEAYALYADVCRIAVESGAFGLAWIGLLGPSGEWVQMVARAGAAVALEQVPVRDVSVSEPDRCAIATAVGEQRTVIVNDVGESDDAAPWRRALAAVQMRSVGAFPVRLEGEVIGALVVAAGEPGYFKDAETHLLEEVAGDISFALDVLRREEKRAAAEARIQYLAYYDAHTGLPGRQLFIEHLAAAVGETPGPDVAVLAVRLRRYHSVLQVLGQGAGVGLARAIVARLENQLPTAFVARVSESEFACVLARGDGLDQIEETAWRVHGALAQAMPADGREVFLDPFIGIALCPRDGSPDEALKAALLAAAKEPLDSGAACRFYLAGMDSGSRERLDLEAALRRALERREFVLHFQPQVALATGAIVGAEALIRWQRPDVGLVPPKDFIPLLEETGLIVPVGEWVLQEACRQARFWQDEGLPDLRIAVNFSSRQFRESDVSAQVRRALAESGLEPRRLELEITESLVLFDAEAVIRVLGELRAGGVSHALDDFGTGYSSLSYLQRLPVARIKIDYSFVANITSSPSDAAIVRAVVGMAHNLGLSVIAEGVETEGQLGYLKGLQCEEVQGFHFSRPLPAESFAHLVRSSPVLTVPSDHDRAERVLLLVDDEQNVLSSLRRALRRTAYRVLTTTSIKEAFELLATHPVGVIVCDQRMPEMTGTEFLRRAKELYPAAMRIVLSAYAELDSVIDAVNRGAIYKFLPKPWDEDVLLEALSDAFHLHEMETDNRKLTRRVQALLAGEQGA
jgi:EAL domain-containing protein (putative c-di-GMP-specific phosphodiesterase class I)/FixJ family two-component response regulator/GGDEF domain-containing protein